MINFQGHLYHLLWDHNVLTGDWGAQEKAGWFSEVRVVYHLSRILHLLCFFFVISLLTFQCAQRKHEESKRKCGRSRKDPELEQNHVEHLRSCTTAGRSGLAQNGLPHRPTHTTSRALVG